MCVCVFVCANQGLRSGTLAQVSCRCLPPSFIFPPKRQIVSCKGGGIRGQQLDIHFRIFVRPCFKVAGPIRTVRACACCLCLCVCVCVCCVLFMLARAHRCACVCLHVLVCHLPTWLMSVLRAGWSRSCSRWHASGRRALCLWMRSTPSVARVQTTRAKAPAASRQSSSSRSVPLPLSCIILCAAFALPPIFCSLNLFWLFGTHTDTHTHRHTDTQRHTQRHTHMPNIHQTDARCWTRQQQHPGGWGDKHPVAAGLCHSPPL